MLCILFLYFKLAVCYTYITFCVNACYICLVLMFGFLQLQIEEDFAHLYPNCNNDFMQEFVKIAYDHLSSLKTQSKDLKRNLKQLSIHLLNNGEFHYFLKNLSK